MSDTATITEKPLTKAEITAIIEEALAATSGKPNKFIELLFCRRTLSVMAVILVVVAKHFGLNINEEELLTVGVSVFGLVLSHGLRKPS